MLNQKNHYSNYPNPKIEPSKPKPKPKPTSKPKKLTPFKPCTYQGQVNFFL
ncbi:hypothetical protein AZO1586I_145 [Bathymodiolus thermophilus thioautotrophic gill symbiont]|uniref:Uncharacterized protein n=1 Tax=Bathymodiolus thermophilus thioautotrophic gill symbiont TaxID=2360 RepID=A0ABN7G843_9GAMM|nr:hypothetical protein AZO1586I_145 [Bathymodiolus thermophilus thioautotrophic gill symbiont]CAC9512169.1 hypothetical protein [uncultured Gammaproteobacteria bacterium]VVH55901.1 hypothetical protein BAZOLSSOX_345 [uncultured Gammaproteobacteria bacterium]VVH56943.1 hypothetical protein BAZOLSSOX_1222 [uncultured Gammaproteobacteria bacterium]VVH59003.1 hypothetical protein BAZOLSSOX_1401 [uncultured Gammaproteobacteria bacterium]